MTLRKYYILIFVFILFYCHRAAGGGQSIIPDVPSDTLEVVKVEATHYQLTREEASGSLITLSPQDLSPERVQAEAFSDMMDQVPGLVAQNRYNPALGERIMMRGMGWRSAFGIRGIHLLLNGIPLTLPDGQTGSTLIEPLAIQSIQAIRGPASAYWGNGSNGVIYLDTRPPSDAPSVLWRSAAGAYDTYSSYLQWKNRINKRRVSGYFSALSTLGYRDHNAAQIIRFGADAEIYSSLRNTVDMTLALLSKPKAQHPGSLSSQALHSDRRGARSSFIESDAGEEALQGQAGIRWRHNSEQLKSEYMLFGSHRLLENRLPFAFIELNRWTGGLRTMAQSGIGRWRLSGGIHLSLQRDDRLERENKGGKPGNQVFLDQLETVWNAAAFFQSTVKAGDWLFTGSVRYDRLGFSADDNPDGNIWSKSRSGERLLQAWSPYAGLQYSRGRFRYFLNAGTAFQSPTTTELVNDPQQMSGFNTILQPQKSAGAEAGLATVEMMRALSIELVAFYIRIRNLLLPYQMQTDGPTYFKNSGMTRHWGIEYKLDWRPRNLPISFYANYSLIQARFVDYPDANVTGNTIPGIPDHRIHLTAVWQPALWTIVSSLHWNDSYPADNRNTAFVRHFTDIKLSVSRVLEIIPHKLSVKPFFQLNNLLNQNFSSSVVVNAFGGRYYEPAPPRTWRVGLSAELN